MEPATRTPLIPTSTDNNNQATIPTPITTALPNSAIPLYIPQVNPSAKAEQIQVEYLGPGNGGSTIYQVVMEGHSTDTRQYLSPPLCCGVVKFSSNFFQR
jgi:hypothetical protein